MPKYDVQFVASAAKEFRDLPEEIKARVAEAVDALEENARPRGVRKLRAHQRLFRIRVGQYRVVYEINELKKSVLVTRIRHRKEAYR